MMTRMVLTTGAALLKATAMATLLLAMQPAQTAYAAPGPFQVEDADRREKSQALDELLDRLDGGYVYPAIAGRIAERVNSRRQTLLASGSSEAFATAVQALLTEVSQDKHLQFTFNPALHGRLTSPPTPSEEPVQSQPEQSGFDKVAVLDGNIGLLDIRQMMTPDARAGGQAAGAMAFLNGSSAVIIDLRRNGGGDGRMNQLLSSYFFDDADHSLLIRNQNRSEGTDVQERTLVWVPGTRMPDTPLYFLVDGGTGSAAEGFAYNLQALGRAKVIGEPTAGAAHSGSQVALPGGFVVFLPTGLTINPITNKNWEGVGVQPDIRIGSDQALDKALEVIWRSKLDAAEAGSPEAERAAWSMAYHAAMAQPVAAFEPREEVVGVYGSGRRIIEVEGRLYLAGETWMRRLIPLGDKTYVVEGADSYGPGSQRVRFLRNAENRVVTMQLLIRHQPLMVFKIDEARAPS